MSVWKSIYEDYFKYLESRRLLIPVFNTLVSIDHSKKIAFIYDQLYVGNYLPKLDNSPRKSVESSITFRNLGNDALCRKADIDALKYYTRSVASSPPNSEQLAFAYDNRSAVLLRMNRYRGCLLDINRALELPFPLAHKHELMDRKKACIVKIKTMQDDTEFLLNSISDLSIDDDWIRNALKNGYKSCAVDENSIETDYELKFPLPPADLNNLLTLHASSKIKLEYNEKIGRHLVATDFINAGQAIVLDKPFAFILDPDYHYSHCSNCCVRCEMLIPCPCCSSIMFCSQKCLQYAFDRYHKVECEILQSLLPFDLNKSALLTLRTLLVATNQGRLLTSLMRHPMYGQPFVKLPFDDKKVYDSHTYDSVHNMTDNFEKRDNRYQLNRCCTVALLVHVLKYSNYFDMARSELGQNEKPGALSEFETFAGTLLLKYMYVIETNCHSIVETIERQPDSPKRSLSIGVGLYPLISMANHACDSNLVRLNHKNDMVFYTLTPIFPGEQLTDNYGVHFTTHTLEERRVLAKNYLFECECDPCTLNWPLYDHLSSQKVEYLSKTMDEQKLELYSKLFEEYLADPMQSTIEDEYKFLSEYLFMMKKSVKQPCKTYLECQEALRQLILLRTNYYTYCIDLIVE